VRLAGKILLLDDRRASQFLRACDYAVYANPRKKARVSGHAGCHQRAVRVNVATLIGVNYRFLAESGHSPRDLTSNRRPSSGRAPHQIATLTAPRDAAIIPRSATSNLALGARGAFDDYACILSERGKLARLSFPVRLRRRRELHCSLIFMLPHVTFLFFLVFSFFSFFLFFFFRKKDQRKSAYLAYPANSVLQNWICLSRSFWSFPLRLLKNKINARNYAQWNYEWDSEV